MVEFYTFSGLFADTSIPQKKKNILFNFFNVKNNQKLF
jgi:hypothetical protein